jgi:uncharacterized repeat protein (TIGR03803 family)
MLQIAMKKLLLLLVALVSASMPLAAQTFTTLYKFHGLDGGLPQAGLVISNGTLYGTTTYGGSSDNGTVFKINTDGSGFTNLHVFTARSSQPFGGTNNDGASPFDSLVLAGDTLYGTTHNGGSFGVGTIFAVNTDGRGFTNLHSFAATPGSYPYTNSDGAYPYAGLVLLGNTLYGTAFYGGSSGQGTVFAINTDGTGFTNLHDFTALSVPYSGTNSDGANPVGGLCLWNNILYGTATGGGPLGNGVVFALKTDGTGFTNLYSFTATSGSHDTNSDGSDPSGGLVLSGSRLYGTTFGGGTWGNGTVFGVNTDGTGFTVLHTFSAFYPNTYFYNSDGAWPNDTLVLSGNTLYGTASSGGGFEGTVFAVNTDGTRFTVVHDFTGGSDGDTPYGGLILSGNTLYGMAQYDGNPGPAGNGTVFSISFTPQLSIIPLQPNVVLAWPTNVAGFDYAGFNLQCATNLIPPVVWTDVSPSPVVANGQNTVTNPIIGTQAFFRLIK